MIKVPMMCAMCSEVTEVSMTQDQYDELSGLKGTRRHIQDILPGHSADVRELIISQTCGKCFDKMFAEPEDEPSGPSAPEQKEG